MFDQLEMPAERVYETTLKSSIDFHGIGLHTGNPVQMTLRPAPAGTGVIFRRLDLLTSVEMPTQAQLLEYVSVEATLDNVSSTMLGTTISNQHGISISTIEHLMAAFAGCAIDNVIVELDNVELPIMDGSSLPFVQKIEEYGARPLNKPRQFMRIKRKIAIQDKDRWIYVMPSEDDMACNITVLVEYQDPAIGQQYASFIVSPEAFRDEVAGARTFCNLNDVATMQAQGKALGGSQDNAIVVDKGQVLNEGGLRFSSEFALHKALDLMGDLGLLQYPIIGKVSAFKPGHDLNTRFAQALLQSDAYELVDASYFTEEQLRIQA